MLSEENNFHFSQIMLMGEATNLTSLHLLYG